MKKIKLTTLKPNDRNPRAIRTEQFEKLVHSLNKFPKMMNLRPIVIDEAGVIVGGNMRYKALVALGFKEIPAEWVQMAKDFTPEELREFIIKDNVGFGEWDWDELANNWDPDKLNEWGLSLPGFEDEDQPTPPANQNVVKIEFTETDYREAVTIIGKCKGDGLYIGGFLIDKLKELNEINNEKTT
jgi:ParB-like chromosome segregation protein Spo0J